jgi:hypothetical protein
MSWSTSVVHIVEGGCSPTLRGRGVRGVGGLVVVAAILLPALAAPCAVAKEKKPSRVVAGMVSDEADNPIVGAAVELTDLSTGKKSATFTQEGGAYQFTGLQPTRDYEVQANYKGLTSEVRRVSIIDPRNRIVLNLRIPPPKE